MVEFEGRAVDNGGTMELTGGAIGSMEGAVGNGGAMVHTGRAVDNDGAME